MGRLFLPFTSGILTSRLHAGLTVLHTHTQQEAAWVRSSIDWDSKTPHVGRWLPACEDSGHSEGLAAPPARLSSAFIPQLFSTIFIFPLFRHTHLHTHTHKYTHTFTHWQTNTELQTKSWNLSGTQISLVQPPGNLRTQMCSLQMKAGSWRVEQNCLVFQWQKLNPQPLRHQSYISSHTGSSLITEIGSSEYSWNAQFECRHFSSSWCWSLRSNSLVKMKNLSVWHVEVQRSVHPIIRPR